MPPTPMHTLQSTAHARTCALAPLPSANPATPEPATVCTLLPLEGSKSLTCGQQRQGRTRQGRLKRRRAPLTRVHRQANTQQQRHGHTSCGLISFIFLQEMCSCRTHSDVEYSTFIQHTSLRCTFAFCGTHDYAAHHLVVVRVRE